MKRQKGEVVLIRKCIITASMKIEKSFPPTNKKENPKTTPRVSCTWWFFSPPSYSWACTPSSIGTPHGCTLTRPLVVDISNADITFGLLWVASGITCSIAASIPLINSLSEMTWHLKTTYNLIFQINSYIIKICSVSWNMDCIFHNFLIYERFEKDSFCREQKKKPEKKLT